MSSQQWVDMPAMSETFQLGGNVSRPVIVLFEGEWQGFAERAIVGIRLTIDGAVQSGPSTVAVDHRPFGEPDEGETHGFNFVSDPIAPGAHTARIQWISSLPTEVCVGDRSLIILHR